MVKGMNVVATCYGHKIYYESKLYEQFIVLWPKWNGSSEMHRFDSEEDAKNFISEQVPESWFERHLS